MGEQGDLGISWCDYTLNLWWGCWKIADECKNCYADATANRFGKDVWGREAPRQFFGESLWKRLRKWNAEAKTKRVRARVFVGSMMDWAERHPNDAIRTKQDAALARFWVEAAACDSLDFLMLTKRPGDAAKIVPWRDGSDPPRNIWIGTTAGTAKAWKENVPLLRLIRARVFFVSCEPMLEAIPDFLLDDVMPMLDWVIVGDESGPGARPAQVEWIRGVRDAAARHRVAFHFKQWAGAVVPAGIDDPRAGIDPYKNKRKIHLPILDGKQHAEFPS